MIEIQIKPWLAANQEILDKCYQGRLHRGHLLYEWNEPDFHMVVAGDAGQWMCDHGESTTFYDRPNNFGLQFQDPANAMLFKLTFL